MLRGWNLGKFIVNWDICIVMNSDTVISEKNMRSGCKMSNNKRTNVHDEAWTGRDRRPRRTPLLLQSAGIFIKGLILNSHKFKLQETTTSQLAQRTEIICHASQLTLKRWVDASGSNARMGITFQTPFVYTEL